MFCPDSLRPQCVRKRFVGFAPCRERKCEVIQAASQIGISWAKVCLSQIDGLTKVFLGKNEVALFISKLSGVIELPYHAPGIWTGLLSRCERSTIVLHRQLCVFLRARQSSQAAKSHGYVCRVG